jgi:hypothetical protein
MLMIMNRLISIIRGSGLLVVVLPLAILGCDSDALPRSGPPALKTPRASHAEDSQDKAGLASQDPKAEGAPTPNAKRLANDIYFEFLKDKNHGRVYVNAQVCLREGNYGLECLMCRKSTKEHESILSTEANAEFIHAALEAARVKKGKPVQFEPKFQPPTGDKVKVSIQYEQKGKTVTVPAQEWVRNVKTKKALDLDWVFAGSILYKDPDDPQRKPDYLAAGEGSYICVTNVPTAMMDLPIASAKDLEHREFAPFTERIPEVGTKVVVILEPIPNTKKK